MQIMAMEQDTTVYFVGRGDAPRGFEVPVLFKRRRRRQAVGQYRLGARMNPVMAAVHIVTDFHVYLIHRSLFQSLTGQHTNQTLLLIEGDPI